MNQAKVALSLSTPGLLGVAEDIKGMSKKSDLAELFALNRVGRMARTESVRAAAKDLGIKQKIIRSRTNVYRGNRRNKVVRVWGGTRAKIGFVDAGRSRIIKELPAGASAFEATMRSGHTGLFYRNEPKSFAARNHRLRSKGNDLPIREAFIDAAPALNEHIPAKSTRIFNSRFDELYWRDFRRRVARKNLRRGR